MEWGEQPHGLWEGRAYFARNGFKAVYRSEQDIQRAIEEGIYRSEKEIENENLKGAILGELIILLPEQGYITITNRKLKGLEVNSYQNFNYKSFLRENKAIFRKLPEGSELVSKVLE